ncbi:MAG: putative sulfate exporter family transporter [Verrucomicrobiales bacterium]|nr:putative sulfate exporter family transporter [Verrucomicrobiales bacterium]
MNKDSYKWADHLIWMEGGEPPPTVRKVPSPWPGIVLAVGLATAGKLVGDFSPILDPILLSMIFGVLAGNLLTHPAFDAGMTFAVRSILPAGIVLLGSRLDFQHVISLGGTALLMSVAVVAAGFVVVFSLQRLWKLEPGFALLLAVGTAICGGTAIVAVAPLVAAKQRDIIMGVGVVTLAGFAGMLALPVIGSALDLSQEQFGILAGLTIHQTPQVVASGFAYGDEAGQTATVVKLARVCLLAPVALLMGWWFQKRNPDASASQAKKKWWQYFPAFALGFLALALVRTLGLLPEIQMTWDIPWLSNQQQANIDTPTFLKLCSGFLLATGMVGVGYQTRLSQFREMGLRPLIASAGSSLIITVVVIVAVVWLF